MTGFVTRQVIPSKQLRDVQHFELTEQMETLWISTHKHTHTGHSHSRWSPDEGSALSDEETQTEERRHRRTQHFFI